MAKYIAPKPTQTKWKKRLFILPAIGELFQVIGNYALGKKLMKSILPSQTFAQFKLTEEDRQQHFQKIFIENKDNNDLIHQTPEVYTHDNCRLDTLEIIPKDLTGEYKEGKTIPIDPTQKYIIKFVGNKSSYAIGLDDSYKGVTEKSNPLSPLGTPTGSIKEMIADARKLKCRVILFNYRGVSEEKNKVSSSDDLIVDGIAQVQRLLDAGVPPENILLKVHSLGGAVGSKTAAYFHKRKEKVFLFNSRSFYNLVRLIVANLQRMFVKPNKEGKKPGHKSTFFGKLISVLAWPIITAIFYFSRSEIKAGDAYKEVDSNHKKYITAKSPEMDIAVNPDILDDTVIPDFCSLHMGLPESDRYKNAEVVVIDKEEKTDIDIRTEVDAHDAAMDALKSHVTNKTAQNIFYEFANEAFKILKFPVTILANKIDADKHGELFFKKGNTYLKPGIKFHNDASTLFNRTINMTIRVIENERVTNKTIRFNRKSLLAFIKLHDSDFEFKNKLALEIKLREIIQRPVIVTNSIKLPNPNDIKSIKNISDTNDEKSMILSTSATNYGTSSNYSPLFMKPTNNTNISDDQKDSTLHLIAIDIDTLCPNNQCTPAAKIVEHIAEKCEYIAKEKEKTKLCLISNRNLYEIKNYFCETLAKSENLTKEIEKMAAFKDEDLEIDEKHLIKIDNLIINRLYSFQTNVILTALSNKLSKKGQTIKDLDIATKDCSIHPLAKNIMITFEKAIANLAILNCYEFNGLFGSIEQYPFLLKKLKEKIETVEKSLTQLVEQMGLEIKINLVFEGQNWYRKATESLNQFADQFIQCYNQIISVARSPLNLAASDSAQQKNILVMIMKKIAAPQNGLVQLSLYDSNKANIDAIINHEPDIALNRMTPNTIHVNGDHFTEENNFKRSNNCCVIC